MNARVRCRAPAKLNLALRVGPLGADGFHPLATVFQSVAFGDLLYAERANAPAEARADGGAPLQLRVTGATIPDDNTVFRAVGALAAAARERGVEPVPLRMHLVKRVPLGAGLGGGSSDAVAALAACVRLWRLDYNLLAEHRVLPRIAAAVGSDVPFFLVGGTALGTGRGTRIEPLDALERTWLVIAAPPVHVSTPAAYRAFDADHPLGAAPTLPRYRPQLDESWMGNDLAAAVCAREPAIDAVRARLRLEGASSAQMTGSGAAVFGAFAGRSSASRVAARMRADGVWAVATVSTNGTQHRRAVFGSGGEFDRESETRL